MLDITEERMKLTERNQYTKNKFKAKLNEVITFKRVGKSRVNRNLYNIQTDEC